MLSSLTADGRKSMLYAALYLASKIAAGPFMLLLVPLFLSSVAQGYWFTFTSMAGFIMLVDMGFSSIVTQYAAHEFAYLKVDSEKKILDGPEENLYRLSSFFVFALKWALATSLLFIVILLAIGRFWFASPQVSTASWLLPWWIYLIGTAGVFVLNILLCFFEGCGLLAIAQRIRLYMTVGLFITMLILLYRKAGLYALAIPTVISCVIGFLFLVQAYGKVLSQLKRFSRKLRVSWRKEIAKLLSRYAVSWISGYLMFQIYVPLVFRMEGAVDAGRVGISIALWSGIYTFCNLWIYIVTPKLNMLAAQKHWTAFYGIFKKHLGLGVASYLVIAIAAFSTYLGLRDRVEWLNRFADPSTMVLLSLIYLIQTVVNAVAVNLRSEKEEPLLVSSLVSAVYVVVVTLLCAVFLPKVSVFAGLLSSYGFGIPWLFLIYSKKKKSRGDLGERE